MPPALDPVAVAQERLRCHTPSAEGKESLTEWDADTAALASSGQFIARRPEVT